MTRPDPTPAGTPWALDVLPQPKVKASKAPKAGEAPEAPEAPRADKGPRAFRASRRQSADGPSTAGPASSAPPSPPVIPAQPEPSSEAPTQPAPTQPEPTQSASTRWGRERPDDDEDDRPARDSVAARAALALALLLGYYVLAAGLVGGLAYLTVQAFAQTGSGLLSAKLAFFTGIVATAIARAVFAVEKRSSSDEDGVPVTRAEQPELWALVDEVSASLGVPAPDEMRLVDDVNAFVHQDTRLLGLIAGDRHLGLGTALLQVLTVDQLRSVIAHELGHYAGGDTRLSALVYRASATLERTVGNLGPESLLGRLFNQYAGLYQRVSLAVRRRQELLADEGSVRVVGAEVHESALREASAAGAAWSFFGARYVTPLWEAGTAPRNLYTGFRTLLQDPVRQQQVDRARRSDGDAADPYDSHPSLLDRIAHVRHLTGTAPGDGRPARSLLRDAEHVEVQVTHWVNAHTLNHVPDQQFAFTEQLDATPYTVGLSDGAAVLARATASAHRGRATAGLEGTLRLLEEGRSHDLMTALTGDRRDLGPEARAVELAGLVEGPLAGAAACALVHAGRATWRASWAQPVHLVDGSGSVIDLGGALERALRTGGVAALRPTLLALGVPLGNAVVTAEGGTAGPDPSQEVFVVWPDLGRGRQAFDALVTRDQLVLVPVPGGPIAFLINRVVSAVAQQYGAGRWRGRKAVARRVEQTLQVPLPELVDRPGVICVRWDDQPKVIFEQSLRKGWVLRLPGQPKPVERLTAAHERAVTDPSSTAALLRQLVGDRLESRH